MCKYLDFKGFILNIAFGYLNMVFRGPCFWGEIGENHETQKFGSFWPSLLIFTQYRFFTEPRCCSLELDESRSNREALF